MVMAQRHEFGEITRSVLLSRRAAPHCKNDGRGK